MSFFSDASLELLRRTKLRHFHRNEIDRPVRRPGSASWERVGQAKDGRVTFEHSTKEQKLPEVVVLAHGTLRSHIKSVTLFMANCYKERDILQISSVKNDLLLMFFG